MDRFCFSASSHFPWVDKDLPLISPLHEKHGYIVEVGATRTECDVEQAIDVIERVLAAYAISPFFGSAVYLTIGRLDAALASAGSTLRAELRQRCQWFEAAVVGGGRQCKVYDDLCSAVFRDESDVALQASFQLPAETIAAVRHWVEDRWTIDELRSSPAMTKASIEQAWFDPD